MTREIKFRGKRFDNGAWEYGGIVPVNVGTSREYCFVSNGMTGSVSGDYEHGVLLTEVDPTTVSQYTGLDDRNGKEIYEGEILTDKFGSIGVIEWRNGAFIVNFGEVDIFSIEDCFDESLQMWTIGNIHDNPELLKEIE